MKSNTIYRRIRRHRDHNDCTAWREITTIYPDGRYEVAYTFEQGDECIVFRKWSDTVKGLGWASIKELLKSRSGFNPLHPVAAGRCKAERH